MLMKDRHFLPQEAPEILWLIKIEDQRADIQGVFLLVRPKNDLSARPLGNSDTKNFFEGIYM